MIWTEYSPTLIFLKVQLRSRIVNCYLLHVPSLFSQSASNIGGWVSDWLIELAWEYITLTRNNLSIIWMFLGPDLERTQEPWYGFLDHDLLWSQKVHIKIFLMSSQSLFWDHSWQFFGKFLASFNNLRLKQDSEFSKLWPRAFQM